MACMRRSSVRCLAESLGCRPPVEFRNDEGVAGTDGSQGLIQAGAFAVGAGESVTETASGAYWKSSLRIRGVRGWFRCGASGGLIDR